MRQFSVSSVVPASVVPASRRCVEFLSTRAPLGVVILGVTCGVLMFGGEAEKAEAGSWSLLRVEQEGSDLYHVDAKTSQQVPPNGAPSHNSPGPWVASSSGTTASVYHFPTSVVEGVGAYVKSEGRVRAIYKWSRFGMTPTQQAQDNPKPYVTFKISAGATGKANSDSDTGATRNSSKETVEASAWGKSDGPTVVGQTETSKTVSKTDYVMAMTTSDEVATPWIEVKARGEISGGRVRTQTMLGGYVYYTYVPGSTQATVSVSFSDPMSKYLTIGRSGGQAAKLESDPTLDKTKDTWVESDGTVHGHTTYSYNSTSPAPPPLPPLPVTLSQYNNQSFGAALVGSWSSSTTWSWSPSSTGDTKTSHVQEMPFGSMNLYSYSSGQDEWKGSPTGTSEKIVGYMATDPTDGASARAQYALTLHDQWELGALVSDLSGVVLGEWVPPGFITANMPNGNPSQAALTPNYIYSRKAEATQEQKNAINLNAKLTVTAGLSEKSAANIAGITLGASGEESIAVAHTSLQTTLNSQGLAYTATPTWYIPVGQQSWPVIQTIGRRQIYKLNHWGLGGFIGESQLIISTPQTPALRPTWVPNSSTSGYPTTP